MMQATSALFDESTLTKGQLRKLNALRKSVGAAIGDEAFSKWLQQSAHTPLSDLNAEVIADALWKLVEQGRIAIPRGGYIVRRGRRRVIVEQPPAE